MQGSMDKIDQVAGELRAATTHVKNVGRAIVGKKRGTGGSTAKEEDFSIR